MTMGLPGFCGRRIWRTRSTHAGHAGRRSGLEALRQALVSDDPRLLQGATTSPPPLRAVADWPVEGACLVGYCGWQGAGLETVAEVEEFFARTCFDVDTVSGEPAYCRHALNWFDTTPRAEMRAALLPEVEEALRRRGALVAG